MPDRAESVRIDKIDLYLSGGGFRAALGALGAVHFLQREGMWDKLGRVISVSGGWIVNARIAVRRPSSTAVPAEIASLFRFMTRWSWLWSRIASVIVCSLAVAFVAVWASPSWWRLLTLAVALVFLAAVPARICLQILFRSLVGNGKFAEMAASNWTVEHVFVASDLGSSGSVFLSCNKVQPLVYSSRRGIFDGRGVTYVQALRASTALPPVLPPLALRSSSRPPHGLDLGSREWVYKPEPNVEPRTWLVDGGVSGNLGVQFDSRISPDNIGGLELAEGSVLAGYRVDDPYNIACPKHGNAELTWSCRQCFRRSFIVDCSGLRPAPSKFLPWMLHLPGAGVLFHTARSLKILYEKTLMGDQFAAGEALIGVVRTDQLADLTRRRCPRPPENSPEAMIRTGEFKQYRENLATPMFRKILLKDPLTQVCWEACEGAARIKTGLWPVNRKRAAVAVASGYLNACLNVHGPEAIETANQGIQSLDALLGSDCGLLEWWNEVNSITLENDLPSPPK